MMISLFIKLIIYCLFCFFLLGWGFYFSKKRNEMFFWNQKHPYRAFIAFAVSLAFCFLYYFIPFCAIPFGMLSVILLLFSGRYCGMLLYYAVLTFEAVFFSLSGAQILVLLLGGLTGFLLFYSVEESTRYVSNVIIFLICDFVLYCGLLFEEGMDNALTDFLIYSAFRILAEACVLSICLKLTFHLFIRRDAGFFEQISDPEHELMIRLKTINEDAYYHALHTAYLADKMARRIGADALLAKALGYYHRIGLLQGEDTIQNTLTVAASCNFPVSLQNAMQEYGIKTVGHVSKEAAIVQMCDAMVSSVAFLFQKKSDAEPDYKKLTDVIIRKKFECHDFESCELTLEELYEIKKGLVEEKLYYDFLRRK